MPFSFRNTTASFVIASLLIFPMHASAHVLLNMGEQEPDPNMPAIPQEKTGEPMADFETQQMALDMQHADCEKLLTLNHEVKHAFLLTTLFLQRPGSLSKIVGPDCTFLGEAIELALITDNTLTLGNTREILYHLPEMEVLIVSHREKDTVAYGLFIEKDTELQPVEYFLKHREEAERSAAIAKSYAKSVEHIVLPIFDPDTVINDAVFRQEEERPASSSAAKQAVQSLSREVPRSTSSETAVPTEKTTPPESTIPLDSPPADIPSTPSTIKISDTEVLYVGTPSDALPNIQPIGPAPQPEEELGQGIGYWILMIFLALILIVTGIVILRSRATAKNSYQDD
ncbi:MAG: hypothetical protein O3A81_04315 [bacterium]|nr:hypothetical protein [bacterium]